MEQYGLLGLFAASFASSTILPISSEVVVIAFIALGYKAWVVLVVASIGNVLGSLTTYALGYFGLTHLLERFGRIDWVKVEQFRQKTLRYGGALAFFSFLPFLGDLFTLALGLARYNVFKTIPLIALGKTLRYALVIFGAEKVI